MTKDQQTGFKERLFNQTGSLTVEASIGMATFLVVAMTLILLLGGFYTSNFLDECLIDASTNVRSQVALVNAGTGIPLVDEIVFEKILKAQVKEAIKTRKDQRFLFSTDHLLSTLEVKDSVLDYKGDRMKLTVSVDWPINYLSSKTIKIQRSLVCRKWTAFVDIADVLKRQGIKEVYMANHPSVYHTNSQCRSIKNREKRIVLLEDIESDFRECKFCVKERNNK